MPSSTFVARSHAPIIDLTPIWLVTMTAGAEVLRLCTDSADFTSRGNVFTACGKSLEITRYEDRDDRPPRARISLQAVTGEALRILREHDPNEIVGSAAVGPPSFLIELVTSEEPDTVQYDWSDATLRSVEYDSLVIEGELSSDDSVLVGTPALSFTPSLFPAMHKGVP